MTKIVMRLPQSISGLIDLCRWINTKAHTKNMRMIEIGSFYGDSTEIFCKWFGHVIAIDPFKSNIGDVTNRCDMDKVYEAFSERMAKYPNFNFIREFSYDIAHKFQDHFFDFVYIDGSHLYKDVLRDNKLYRYKVKKGGFIGGHDYRKKFGGVIKAVKEQYGKPLKTFKDSSWIVRL